MLSSPLKANLNLLASWAGFAAVSTFLIAFTVFASISPDFDVTQDYISKLGSVGQPNGIWWNVFGFGCTGLFLAGFGCLFGLANRDILLALCLGVAGVGFAAGGIPTDFEAPDSALSSAHYASICIGLAGWCLGLARMVSQSAPDEFVRKSASYVVVASLIPFIAIPSDVSAEPVAHRIVLMIVFAWVALISYRMQRREGRLAG